MRKNTVKEIWRKLKEKSGSSEAKWVLIFGYLFAISSKALGYLRYLFISYFFGASAEMDVFWMVWDIGSFIPSLTRSALDVGAIPVLKEIEIKEGKENAHELAGRINKFLLLGGLLLTAIYPFILPEIITKIAVGFNEAQRNLISPFLLLALPFFSATLLHGGCEIWAICKGKYNLSEKVQVPANIASVSALIILSLAYLSPFWVPISYDLGIILTVILMILYLKPFPLFEKRKVHGLRKIARLSSAAIASSGAGAIYTITDKAFASLLPIGSITSITFAGVALGGLLGPLSGIFSKISIGKLSEDAVKKRMEEIQNKFYKTVTLISFYLIPISVFLWISSPPILSILFMHGRFGKEDLAITVNAFRGYLIGMPFSYMTVLLVRYAQATQRPFKVVPLSYVSAGLNALFDWILVFPLKEFGLTLATSCVQISVAFLMHRIFKKELDLKLQRTLNALLKGCALGGVLFGVNEFLKIFLKNELLLVFLSFAFLLILWLLADKLRLFPNMPEEWSLRWFLRKNA